MAGDALGGAKGEYVSAERNRLETLRLLALQDRIALDLELARHAEVLPELVRLTRLHPLRERWQQLGMLTLYRTGRQAGALQVHRDVHALLVSELGIEPGSELRALHGRVVRADPDLGGPVLAMDFDELKHWRSGSRSAGALEWLWGVLRPVVSS